MICRICRNLTALDDVAMRYGEWCICLRCYERETKSSKRVSPRLQRQVNEE